MSRSSFNDVVERLQPGMRVFLPGMTGESLLFYEALKARTDKAAGVTFSGVHFPGINSSDYMSLHPEARFQGFFMTSPLRQAMHEGRAELFPMEHSAIYRHLADSEPFDIAVMQVSAPDAAGRCSPGISLHFQPAAWNNSRCRVLHINPDMPRTRSDWTVAPDDADIVIEQSAPVITAALAEPDEQAVALANNVATLIRPGDTLQFGVGKMPTAVSRRLSSFSGMKVNSGLITPAVKELVDAGVVDQVVTGVALGEQDFYRSLEGDDRYRFAAVSETHDLATLAAIDGFCSINSAVEVDLFGQVNADSVKGRLLAGVGGLPVYVQAARLSEGGRSIICLPAEIPAKAAKPARSRIVPRLDHGAMTAVPRHGVDCVVTEYGIAELGSLSLAQRARALIAIAAPAQRYTLEKAWADAARNL